jgi:hypothetical protein
MKNINTIFVPREVGIYIVQTVKEAQNAGVAIVAAVKFKSQFLLGERRTLVARALALDIKNEYNDPHP